MFESHDPPADVRASIRANILYCCHSTLYCFTSFLLLDTLCVNWSPFLLI